MGLIRPHIADTGYGSRTVDIASHSKNVMDALQTVNPFVTQPLEIEGAVQV